MWALEVIRKMNSQPQSRPKAESEVEKMRKEIRELKSTVSELKLSLEKSEKKPNENS